MIDQMEQPEPMGWRPGRAPSDINDQARAMMRAMASQIDDNARRAYPIYVSCSEGDLPQAFRAGSPENPRTVHAIWFSDGSVFDALNGWRQPNPYFKPIVRVKMGREKY